MKIFATLPFVFILLAASTASLRADDLMVNGGFEEPAVRERSPKDLGGNPSGTADNTKWSVFDLHTLATAGTLTAGLTNEIAHKGAQSFYVHFDNVTLPYQFAALQTAPISIAPASPCRISLWLRMDKQKPIKIGDRTVYLKIQTEYLKDDCATPAGNPEYRVQPVPGSKNRDPIFSADKWSEFYVELQTPEDAAFMILNLKFETGADTGKANGILFVDDVVIDARAGGKSAPQTKPAEATETAPAPEVKE